MEAVITKMTPEQKYQELFEAMYQLCDQENWGAPFSYARSREIHLAGILGHSVADDYSGADAFDENDNPVEYKSTIGKKLTATYNGISVQPTWHDQVKYLVEEKIGKYQHHFYARYHKGKVVEVPVGYALTYEYNDERESGGASLAKEDLIDNIKDGFARAK